MTKPRTHRLPPQAQGFGDIHRSERKRRAVCRFHRWIDQHHLELSELSAQQLERYWAQSLGTTLAAQTHRRNQSDLSAYLHWLHQRGLLAFAPPRHHARPCASILPAVAHDFLRALHTTRRPNTCATYRSALRGFHRWLHAEGIELGCLQRHQLQKWFEHLCQRALHPTTRCGLLISTRVYLRWLFDRDQLRACPDDLIRRSDLPKLPSYLPRPLPPDLDRAVQSALSASERPLAKGLLLMRHTGLRIGELTALPYDCIRVDLHKNRLLKVPLGKLSSERLVPLHDAACQLIETLQAGCADTTSTLLQRPDRQAVTYSQLRRILVDTTAAIVTSEPITSHRLRHTYATSLLSGGMNLVSVMKLLGHRSITMTLRYTAVTQHSLTTEYHEALEHLANTYGALNTATAPFCPHKTLSELITWLHNHLACKHDQPNLARALIRRLHRIQGQLDRLPL